MLEEIKELNKTVKCKLALSTIHGIGVFAMRDINRGEKVYMVLARHKWFTVPFQKMGKLRPEVKELILSHWAGVVNGGWFLSPNEDTMFLGYCNHSDNPNYEAKTDTALRDIKQGEEITENYKLMENWEIVFSFLH